LVVNGLYLEAGGTGFSIFDVSVVGVPCALVGTGLLLGLGDALLPSRTAAVVIPTDPKEFTVEMKVAKGGVLVGQTIEAAGLRHLPGLYLMEIHRNDRVFAAVEPHEVLEADDQLVFVGVVESVVDLQRIPGLAVATHQVFKLDGARAERCFAQAVVSRACPLVGETIRAGRFRNRYGAVVIAVSRAGQRVPGRIGDIELHVGDVLLLEAPPTFVEQQRNSKDFYLVSRLDTEGPPTTTRAGVAAVILLAMVGLAASGLVSMMQAAFLAAAAMFLSRCVSEESARRSVDWPLLLSIGCAFGLGKALEQSGVASRFAELLLAQAGAEPMVALVVIYATTVLVSELVTNNAAAVIVFPIAVSTAVALGVESRPFVVAVMMAASAAFATPLGYQTHLMVYGPGGYRLGDFLKIGIPMNLAVGATACFLIPRFFPF
ncbi:MAG: SLC13 family permease, partial [Sandaracinaceae bacterium]